jgi:hypothetical protein
LTQTIETLRTIRLNLDQRCIVKDVDYTLESNYETTLELDSHADTCVLGRDALVILDFNQPVSVVGYDESLGSKTYLTVSGAVAYDDPQNGRKLHLIITIRDSRLCRLRSDAGSLATMCRFWVALTQSPQSPPASAVN